ncbi:CGNR zinc finger domain-containing protein [Jatrophihabitans telluris]|uniref:CGNR zinc finger domain-containing protein n=1 Tax=Jatrophihabitans telluris TaxID=2038343 RepID=A0ABY4QY96_9ACTN|nr:CGNR zinc finger domain-containing protein [Jatrophihabitans telluris]UQX88475.1 CGNR zinc finger domain-containing protein [Jatrophihabitans telluris]
MLFAHDTEVALAGAAALVNTSPDRLSGSEELPDTARLDEFVRTWEWTGSRAVGSAAREAELAEVRALRVRLRPLWDADLDQAVQIVNRLLTEARALPQLVKHDQWDYHLHATDSAAPLAQRMAVEAAMAFVDVIRMDELGRLRTCAAEDCEDVLVDLSKNSSRRFCDRGCGNRANVAAYRARRREQAG